MNLVQENALNEAFIQALVDRGFDQDEAEDIALELVDETKLIIDEED